MEYSSFGGSGWMSSVEQGLGDIRWANPMLTLENSISKWAVRKTKVGGIWVYFSFLFLTFFSSFFLWKSPKRECCQQWLIWGLTRPVTLFLPLIKPHYFLVPMPCFGVIWWETIRRVHSSLISGFWFLLWSMECYASLRRWSAICLVTTSLPLVALGFSFPTTSIASCIAVAW